MYGDEELGIPPTRLYTKPYAMKAPESAELVYKLVVKLLVEYEEKSGKRANTG